MPPPETEIRDLRERQWYWIHQAVIRQYARKIGPMGLLVYNLLASMTDRQQRCFPSQQYLAGVLGHSRATVNRAIQRLEQHGLIKIERRARYHCVYQLLKVRCPPSETLASRCNTPATQMSHQRNSDVTPADTNNTQITRMNNNIVNNDKKISQASWLAHPGPGASARADVLGRDLAHALQDLTSHAVYQAYARKYPESVLRRILAKVQEVPSEKIRKSRAALFHYLVKQYAQATPQDSRH